LIIICFDVLTCMFFFLFFLIRITDNGINGKSV
jgi:hypothetical protein